MLFYAPNITSRLRYISRFIGAELFDTPEPIIFTDDKDQFAHSSGPKLNYSDTVISADEFYLRPVSLLFETGVRPQPVECFDLNFHKAFFATQGDLPFDIFAASFYLISRYEEYLPHEKDVYGRYAHTQSLAFREGFLDQPLVNIWMQELREALIAKFPDLILRYPAFKFIPTYDIDIAWSYLHKGWFRNMGGLFRSALQGKWSQIRQRVAVLRGLRQDPYDAYEWLDSLHLYCRVKPRYFFLVAARQTGVDKNIPPDKEDFQNLVKYHGAGYQVGLHPSWQSGDNESVLKEEKEWLEWTIDQRVTRSRQHFIRFRLPDTYRQLIGCGIETDYSMGYGSINGLRASVASSFFWYDLEKEEQTSLRIFPFCFMDANSFYEQKYTAARAREELMHYYRVIRKVNGLMITIWHNNFLGTDPDFAGWRTVYEVFLKEEVFWDA